MPENKKAKELMVPISEYPVVYDTDTVKEAITTLKNYLTEGKEHRSLLVFSKTKKVGDEEELVGILTVRDILNTIKRNRESYHNAGLYTFSWASFYHKDPVTECTVINVGRAIRPLTKAFIQADDNVTKAIELMLTKNVNILPVFEGKVAVGIIRAVDILDYIGEII